CMQGLEFPWTL
nr:immunoglobulin light chain junction region [Macaca mulatta]